MDVSLFSSRFDRHLRAVSWLINDILRVANTIILMNPAGRLRLLDDTTSDKVFGLTGFYATND